MAREHCAQQPYRRVDQPAQAEQDDSCAFQRVPAGEHPRLQRKKRNPSTRFWRWRSTRRSAGRKGWSWRAAWSSAIAAISAKTCPRSMRSSGPTKSTESLRSAKELTSRSADPAPYLYHDLTPRILATPRHFAYMKIAEGCDHPCTFCVIPQYRGNFRSRRFESVVSEATRLFRTGRARNQSDRPGYDLLRRRFRPERRIGAIARAPRADRDAAAEVGSFPLRLPE